MDSQETKRPMDTPELKELLFQVQRGILLLERLEKLIMNQSQQIYETGRDLREALQKYYDTSQRKS